VLSTAKAQRLEPSNGAERLAARHVAEEELKPLCAQTEKTDALEQVALKTYTSDALKKALHSEPEMWRFITDPSTAYLDRMAAANRGAALIGPEDLPLLWKTATEFELLRLPVTASPCEYWRSANRLPEMWLTRKKRTIYESAMPESQSVLGRKIDLRQDIVDYPVSPDERNRSSWLWQTQRAVTLLNGEVNRYYGDPARYPLLVEAAWQWQPATYYEANTRFHALLDWAPYNVLRLQTILKLALPPLDTFNLAYAVPTHLYLTIAANYHFEELEHVAQIVILQKTQDQRVAAETAFVTAQLANLKENIYAPQLKPLHTATAILAIGRWAMDRDLPLWDRFASFAEPICKIVDDPPFQPGQIRDPHDPEVAKRLLAFEHWFALRRSSLELQAASEKPHLQSLAEELSQKIQ
jgi:hypothetical protein